jgi:enamine deaminase RidA (YjgF/YER057c/UK114 family)
MLSSNHALSYVTAVRKAIPLMQRRQIDSGTPWEAMAGYARAVRVGGVIYISGTTAAGADGVVQHREDAAAQTHYIIDKCEAALAEAGAGLADVVRTRIFVRDLSDWPAVARAHGARFGTIRPACTLVRAELIDPAMLVEIEAEAVITPHG